MRKEEYEAYNEVFFQKLESENADRTASLVAAAQTNDEEVFIQALQTIEKRDVPDCGLMIIETILELKAYNILPCLVHEKFPKIKDYLELKKTLFLLLIQHSRIFNNASDKMKNLRIQFLKEKFDKKDLIKDCLSILSAAPGAKLDLLKQAYPGFPSPAVICAAINRFDLLPQFLTSNKKKSKEKTHLLNNVMVALVLNDNRETLQFMLEKGYGLDDIYETENSKRWEPLSSWTKLKEGSLLSIAVQINDLSMFEFLCEKGASISEEVIETIFLLKKEDFLKLFEIKAPEYFTKPKLSTKLLQLACNFGDNDLFQLLLEKIKKSNPDFKMPKSVLESAISKGQGDIVEFLHKTHHFTLPTFLTKNNVLIYLLQNKHNRLVAYLIENGINQARYTSAEWTDVLIAMAGNNFMAGIKGSFETHPVTDHPDLWCKILSAAILCENLRLIETLSYQGLSLNQFDQDGLSPLFLAICNHKFEAAKKLIELNLKVLEARNSFGETAVMFATQIADNGDFLKLILEELKKFRTEKEIADFVNLKTSKKFSALNNPCDFENRLNPFFTNGPDSEEWRINRIGSLYKAGAKFFEEQKQEEAQILPCYQSTLENNPSLSSIQEWNTTLKKFAVKILGGPEPLPLGYLPVLSHLLSEFSAEQNSFPELVEEFKQLNSKKIHLKHCLALQALLMGEVLDKTANSLCEGLSKAFGISAPWTKFILLFLINEVSQDLLKVKMLCRAILSLPNLPGIVSIHFEMREKCKLIACKSRDNIEQKNLFLKLGIIFANPTTDAEEIALLYQLLDGTIYGHFSSITELAEYLAKLKKGHIVKSLEETVEALRKELLISQVLKTQNNKALFKVAALKSDLALIKDLVATEPDLLILPWTNEKNSKFYAFDICSDKIREELLIMTANFILSKTEKNLELDGACITRLDTTYKNMLPLDLAGKCYAKAHELASERRLIRLRSEKIGDTEFMQTFYNACKASLDTVQRVFQETLHLDHKVLVTCLILTHCKLTTLCKTTLDTILANPKQYPENYPCLLALRVIDFAEQFPKLDFFTEKFFNFINLDIDHSFPSNISLDQACSTFPIAFLKGLIKFQLGICSLLDINLKDAYDSVEKASNSTLENFALEAYAILGTIQNKLGAYLPRLPWFTLLLALQAKCVLSIQREICAKFVALQAEITALKAEKGENNPENAKPNIQNVEFEIAEDQENENKNKEGKRIRLSDSSSQTLFSKVQKTEHSDPTSNDFLPPEKHQ